MADALFALAFYGSELGLALGVALFAIGLVWYLVAEVRRFRHRTDDLAVWPMRIMVVGVVLAATSFVTLVAVFLQVAEGLS